MELLTPNAARATLYAATRSRRRYTRHLKAHEGFFKWLAVVDGFTDEPHLGGCGIPTIAPSALHGASPLDICGPLHLTPVALVERRAAYERIGNLMRSMVRNAVNRGNVPSALVHPTDPLFDPTSTASVALFNSVTSPTRSAAHTCLLGMEGSSSFARVWWTSERCKAIHDRLLSSPRCYGPSCAAGDAFLQVLCEESQPSPRMAATVSSIAKCQSSRPSRQELENLPQELNIAFLAKETIEHWECGKVLVPFLNATDDSRDDVASVEQRRRTFRHSQRPSWSPRAVVDLGGGNGSLVWITSLAVPGVDQAVNAERFVTRYNQGIVTCEDDATLHDAWEIASTTANEVDRGLDATIRGEGCRSVFVPNGGCSRSTFGHGELSLDQHGCPPHAETTPLIPGEDERLAGEGECCPSATAVHHCLKPPASAYNRNNWSPIEFPYYRVAHKDLRALQWREDIRHDPRDTFVVTKHLCGEAVDHALRMFDLQQCWPRYLFISSCCHIKGCFSAYINQQYLRDVLHIHTDAEFRMLASKTAWLHQYDPTNPRDQRDEEQLSWQNHLGKAAEELLDYGRVLWLRQRGYVCEMVEHIPHTVTPRNHILVARRIDGLLCPS